MHLAYRFVCAELAHFMSRYLTIEESLKILQEITEKGAHYAP